MMVTAIEVQCPDCNAPAATPCRMGSGTGAEFHAERHRVAELRSLERGVCQLCGAFMVRGLDPIDAWHPDPTEAAACPVMPDPRTDWPAYAKLINSGVSPGHPGIEFFVPEAEHLPGCNKECGNGTHVLLASDSVIGRQHPPRA